MHATSCLRDYLKEHPEIREHIAEWVEDFLIEQAEKCWLRWFCEMPLVTYLNQKAEGFIVQKLASELRAKSIDGVLQEDHSPDSQ